jgi:hypothetical protein
MVRNRRHGQWIAAHRVALDLEVAGSRADPNLVLDPGNTQNTALWSMTVGPYLSAVDKFSSPGDNLFELGTRPRRGGSPLIS